MHTRDGRYFNTAGACDPKRHYMVDITERLKEIKRLVDQGDYFTINRARQYGKTTTIQALVKYLEEDYIVISLDFQMIGNEDFGTEVCFARAFVDCLLQIVRNRRRLILGFDEYILNQLESAAKQDEQFTLKRLFVFLSDLCDTAKKPVVMLIDEVDSATNNQVFLDFLAQLRAYYLQREELSIFQSVILAGVYDVKNIKRKIRPDEEHKVNSPWNIAADFKVRMNLPEEGIAGMLKEYEADHHTGMDVAGLAKLLFDYTSGYPFLVSRLCKLIDEDVAGNGDFPDEKAAWTKDGFLEAVKMLLMERNTLFESLMGKVRDYPELAKKLYAILFAGKSLPYNPDDTAIDLAQMFGLVRNEDGRLVIANRIFETRLYNYFLSTDEALDEKLFTYASDEKSQFVHGGHLDVEKILAKFVEHFDQIYGDNVEPFDEDEGGRRFLLYLRPIINGTGNYYVEDETRNSRRMDVVVDYRGEQFIIELKIWHGNAYNERGERQLSDYLDYFHLKKGYMLSYNFNKKKEIGVKEVRIDDRVLIEAVV